MKRQLDIKIATKRTPRVDARGVLVSPDRTSPLPLDWDFLASTGFEAKAGEVRVVPGDDGVPVIVTGVGDPSELDLPTIRRAVTEFVRAAARFPRASLAVGDLAVGAALAGQAVGEGLLCGNYRFDRYKADPEHRLHEVTVVTGAGRTFTGGMNRGRHLAEAVNFARDLVNEPGGRLTPSAFAKIATERAMQAGIRVKVYDEKAIAEANLGGILAVNKGSEEPARLLQLTYSPAAPRHTMAWVGKGVTFDSGGLSIKPADGMMTMKCDMAGAAAVVAAICALPALKVPHRVVAWAPLTDNMTGGNAQRPGDIFTARNGKSVEVLNTDAEGRLILADALALATESGPDAVVDLATLTGACMVGLGHRIAGLMGNDESLLEQLQAAAGGVGERVWPLPLPDDYRKLIDSPIADLKNIGGKYGGAMTAGLFLREFVAEGVPWAHLDIAGPAFSDDQDGEIPKGGTGFGVRTLVELAERFERPTSAGGPAPSR